MIMINVPATGTNAKKYAVELRHHILGGGLNNNLYETSNKLFQLWQLSDATGVSDCTCTEDNDYDYKNYDYYGIYVFVGTGTVSGNNLAQGRIIYSAKRYRRTESAKVKVPFIKVNESENKITSDKAKFKIKCDSNWKIGNATEITKESNDFVLNFKNNSSNPGSFQFTIEETDAPEGYKRLEGKVTVKVTYYKNDGATYKKGDIKSVSFTYANSADEGKCSYDGGVGIKIKNEVDENPENPEYYIKKVDQYDKSIGGVTFKLKIKVTKSGYASLTENVTVESGLDGMTENILSNTTIQNKLKNIIKAEWEKGNTTSKVSIDVTVNEINVPKSYIKKNDVKFTLKYDGRKVTLGSKINCYDLGGNTATVKIVNERISPIMLTIKKVVDTKIKEMYSSYPDTDKGLITKYKEEGKVVIDNTNEKNNTTLEEFKNNYPNYFAKFNVIAEQDGNTIYNAHLKEEEEGTNETDAELLCIPTQVNSEGLRDYDTTRSIYPNSYNPITFTITEVQTPEDLETAEQIVIKFTYNNIQKIWEPTVTEGADQLSEYSEGLQKRYNELKGDGNNRYYPSKENALVWTERRIEDGIEVLPFNTSFGIRVKNKSNLIKNVELYKKDKNNNSINGAKFNVQFENIEYVKIGDVKKDANSSNMLEIQNLSSNASTGLIANIQEIKALNNSNTVYMTVEETEAPGGFGKLPTKARLQIRYNETTKKWILETRNNNELSNEFYQIDNANDKLTLTLKDDYKLDKLTILKTDSLDGNKVQGAKFNVTLGNVKSVKGYSINSSGTTILTGVTTNANGNIELEDVVISDITKPITITMEETDAPEGYKKIDGKVTVKLIRDGNVYKIIEQSKEPTVLDSEFKVGNATVSESENTVSIGIKDIPALQELNLFKLDSQKNSSLTGAEFKVNFSNVESYYVNGVKKKDTSTTVTVDEGKALIEKILLKDINSKATITLEETKAPIGYKKLVGKIYLTVEYTNEGYKITATKDETISNKEFNTADVGITNKKNANVTIKDIPVMNIGGIVWEDKQYGEKLADVDERYKGIPEDINDILLSGVEVYLTDGEPQFDDGRVKNAIAETKTANGGEKVTYVGHMGEVKTTLQKGEYLFAGIEKKDNYYVVFKYDGINYITVEKGTENNASKVEEKGRAEFNKKFQTIESGKAIAEDGSSIDLYYNSANGKSKLITKDNEGNIKPEFVMYAQSDKVNSSDWQNTWTEDGVVNKADSRLNINCGIKDRFFDLAIGMDVESAKLTINGKETKYNYNQILNGELEDIDFDKISKNATDGNGNAIEYNLYLYYSDYNYRISDYITDGIDNNISTPNEGEDKDSKVLDDKVVNEDEELRAFVTYKVIIKNQSTVEDAKVNKLAYYYDTNYKFDSAKDEYGNDIEFTTNGTKEINGDIKNYAEINLGENAKSLGSDEYRQELYFTFEVKKSDLDGDGREESLPQDILHPEGLKCANIVEILSYSTNDGLIDHDSAPGNLETVGYEDDTDEAIGLNITLRENERKITGTVFDDTYKQNPDGSYNIYDKDGFLNNNNKAVNDVIVQLIEVKPIENESGTIKYYEYIWQETRSGSNTVKTTAKNGSTTESYTNSVVENSGIYEFTNFIPGNYIIRFIYGDGSTYDLTDNVKTYNGQDYQSTKDPNYKSSWYNTAGYVADDNGNYPSVARDNEARRLDVMAYSTMIDNTKGTDLELTSTDEGKIKYTLKNTWMAAETSRINVPVDAETTKTEEDKTEVSFEYIINKIEFNNMNFGLAKRPETKLKLEKHITSLKIVPNGVGVKPIIEAKAKKIEDIVNCTNANGETVELQGVTTGLTAISSTRGNRNFWKVETDIEELAQGATLEVEYTYVIKNDSDEDYLGSELVNQYKTNLDGYSDYLKDLKKSVKAIMRTGQYAYSDINAIGGYLGEFYYTGNKGTSDSPVLSRAETLKESLNEQFGKQSTVGDYFNVRDFDNSTDINTYKDTDGNDVSSGKNISTVIESNSTSEFLKRKAGSNYTDEDADWSKTAKVTTVLSVSSNGTIGGNYPSYIAEITKYSNAAGRRNMEATPGNLSYVHSEATDITMNSVYNEDDEFWGESIIISKPTGEDKLSGVQIAVISTISVAILGAGIILIKKFVLKK